MNFFYSIFRDIQQIYQSNIAQQKLVLWSYVNIALVVSAVILWVIEHRKVRRLERNKPILHADFNVESVHPTDPGLQLPNSFIGITAYIINTGIPSIISNIEVTVAIGNKLFQGQSIITHKDGSYFMGTLEGKPVNFKSHEDPLMKYLSQTINTNSRGIGLHIIFLPNLTNYDVFRPGTVVVLSFQDVFDKKYEFKKFMDEPTTLTSNLITMEQKDIIGYIDFLRLLKIDIDPQDWLPDLSVRPDGVWAVPVNENLLKPKERAFWSKHPNKNLFKRVLDFPCTYQELEKFLNDYLPLFVPTVKNEWQKLSDKKYHS